MTDLRRPQIHVGKFKLIHSDSELSNCRGIYTDSLHGCLEVTEKGAWIHRLNWYRMSVYTGDVAITLPMQIKSTKESRTSIKNNNYLAVWLALRLHSFAENSKETRSEILSVRSPFGSCLSPAPSTFPLLIRTNFALFFEYNLLYLWILTIWVFSTWLGLIPLFSNAWVS